MEVVPLLQVMPHAAAAAAACVWRFSSACFS
jgi:hypothetical protein